MNKSQLTWYNPVIMNDGFTFTIEHKLQNPDGTDGLGRVAVYETPHGPIKTPAFAVVGTKATVKGLTPEMVRDLDAQIFLANTYHLYFAPGEEVVKKAGGLHKFARWDKPMMTDSGGFQAFSLGAAFGTNVSKIAKEESGYTQHSKNENKNAMAIITEEGVEFKSHRDGSMHTFTAEKSIGIQQDLGADIYFAFDECTSPQADYLYQKEAMIRTHRWAERSLAEHKRLEALKETLRGKTSQADDCEVLPRNVLPQAIFGVVQGGRHLDLRQQSAETLGAMDFDGYGVGGSFDKHDMDTAVKTAATYLPENKPRHLLGIGEVEDFFLGVENGMDTFDCVAPTRMARHGSVHTKDGKKNMKRAPFRQDFTPIEEDCGCYACTNYTRAYICHLLREGEMLGSTLTTIHNLYFVTHLVDDIRQSIIEGNYWEFKDQYLKRYFKK